VCLGLINKYIFLYIYIYFINPAHTRNCSRTCIFTCRLSGLYPGTPHTGAGI